MDAIPKEFWDTYTPKNWAEFGRALGYKIPKAALGKKKAGISREHLSVLAKVDGNASLKKLAESDIHWDRIVSIEKMRGDFEVWDIEIDDEAHNFVANDIIVHNSRTIGALPKMLGIEPHNIHGHRSPLHFYGEVFEHKDSLIAVEEAEVIQANPQIKTMFRLGFYAPHQFEWKSTKNLPEGIPDNFKFDGSVCFGVNGLSTIENPHTDASYDRFFIANIRHTNRQIREKQRHKRSYKPNREAFQLIGERIRLIQNNPGGTTLSAGDYRLLDIIMDENYQDSEGKIPDVYSKGCSVRDIEKLEMLAWCAKALFGSLADDAVLGLVKRIFFGLGVEPKSHIIEMVRKNPELRYKELVEHISWNEHISLRSAYRRIADLVNEGKLKKEGKLVKVV